MTFEKVLWMQQVSGAPAYEARVDRDLLFAQMWDEGVMALTGLKVTQRATGANFTVDVSTGVAVVTGDDQANQGNYIVRCTAIEQPTVSGAPSAPNSRYDIVCLRINDSNAGGNTGQNASIVITAGTPGTSPTVPAVPASSLLLAVIGPITNATSSITDSIIFDASNWSAAPAAAQATAKVAHLPAGRRDQPGVSMDYFGTIAPSGWLFEDGSAVSRTTYAALWTAMGKPNTGDGSTTFNVPDSRGRVLVGLDNMGGTDAGRLDVANTLNASGGEQYHTLTQAELPNVTLTIDPPSTALTLTDPGHAHAINTDGSWSAAGSGPPARVTGSTDGTWTGSTETTGITGTVDIAPFQSAALGSGSSHNVMQPYLLCNRIVRT